MQSPKPRRQPELAVAAFVVAVLIFYWVPLTDPDATPQWDTIDVHYSVQKFAADELRSFHIPHWSEYAFSGFPFSADPQVGIWYPLNWPFFVVGISPKVLQLEIAVHILLACAGMWLLASLWFDNPWAAGAAALFYGFSGFFAGHASHLGILQSAAWLPLILYSLHRFMRDPKPLTALLTGTATGMMFLAGHTQTALYTFCAMAVYAAMVAAVEKKWRAALIILPLCAVLTVALGAIQWLPTLELAAQSVREGVTYVDQTNGVLEPRALMTLIAPNYYGSVRPPYTGPEDITQFYFYAGLTLLPLAIAGIIWSRTRWAALALIVPFLWYAFGPAGGFYRVIASLPLLGRVRAPVHDWFVVALALALLAGGGLAAIAARVKFKWLALAIGVVSFADLFYWNSLENQLAYYRGSFDQHYGTAETRFKDAIGSVLPEGTRFHAPHESRSFGPLNAPYDVRIPVTFGSNPLPLKRYTAYVAAAASNPKLLNGLATGLVLVPETGALVPNEARLPKFYFARSISTLSQAETLSKLATADPALETILEGPVGDLRQDPAATARIESASDEHFVVRCDAGSPSLLRTAIPWYPAWRATVDHRPATVRIADHAMAAIEVPAGSHTVAFDYSPNKFYAGAWISGITAVLLIAAAVIATRRSRA